MSHELEQHEGLTAFVSGRGLSGWHLLGQVLKGSLSAAQALEQAYLNGWCVRKVPALVTLEQIGEDGVTSETVEVADQYAVVRDNPFTHRAEVIGRPGAIVGRVYEPFQNEQAVDFLAAVTDEYSDAQFETAGSIRHGSQVFVTMLLKNFMVGGVDAHNMYLAYLLNHGTGSNVCFPTNTRLQCANTVDYGLANARYTFRHSANIDTKHQQARDALRLAFNYQAKFEAEAEALLAVPCELDEFRKVCREIWPTPQTDEPEITKRRHAEREGVLRQLFLFADTQDGIRLTRWGAFNAIVEYLDHVAPAKGKTAAAKAEARALRTIDGIDTKKQAFDLLKV